MRCVFYNVSLLTLPSSCVSRRVFTGTHPAAAGILSLLGFYWLCRASVSVMYNIPLVTSFLDQHQPSGGKCKEGYVPPACQAWTE